MAKYRKKPIVIEAIQWFKMGDHPAVVEILEKAAVHLISYSGLGWIETREGGHIVSPGDWIITGIKGEHYPCKPDIFEATYALAEEAQCPASS